MILEDEYCKECGEKYTSNKWCKPFQISYLKKIFINCSGNEKIDNFIQKVQLKIDKYNDIVFEWIPYNQFNDINNIKKANLVPL